MSYEYTEQEFRDAFEYEYRHLIKGKFPSKQPCGIVLGGQPGAGKTTLHNVVKSKNSNCVIINGDFYRAIHPRFEEIVANEEDYMPFTGKFSGQLTEALIQKLSDDGYDIVVEGTLRTVEVPEKTARLLKSKGYSAKLMVIVTSKEMSWDGNVKRFEAMKEMGLNARLTTRQVHDSVVNTLSENVTELMKKDVFDALEIYDREENCLCDKTFSQGLNDVDFDRIKTIIDDNLFVANESKI